MAKSNDAVSIGRLLNTIRFAIDELHEAAENLNSVGLQISALNHVAASLEAEWNMAHAIQLKSDKR